MLNDCSALEIFLVEALDKRELKWERRTSKITRKYASINQKLT
jgi:hypothetical protein